MKHVAFLSLLITILCVPARAELLVSEGNIRLLPPGVPNTSAYFSITNKGDKDRVIVSAYSDIVKKVELHTHSMQGDMMMMRQVPQVEVPSGQTVIFASGGLHLMMFGLKAPLQKMQKVNIKLEFKDGETLDFKAVVKEPQAHAHHHHH